MHVLQPNHLPADRALLKVFPQTTSIWGEFGREDRFGQSFEKSQGGMEEREGWEPACLQLSTAIAPARRAHLSLCSDVNFCSGWSRESPESDVAARRGGKSGDLRGTIAPGRAPGRSGASSSLTLREGDEGQGEGEQRQGAEVHAGAAGGGGSAALLVPAAAALCWRPLRPSRYRGAGGGGRRARGSS